MSSRKHLVVATALVGVTAVILYFILTALYQLPVAASREAGPIDTMFQAHFMIIAFLFSLIMVFILYAAVVFRRQPGDTTDGPHVHGHTGLEITWTIVPVVLVIGFGSWAVVTLRDLVRPNPDEMVVDVYGQQWSWSFEYPESENLVSAELVLPVDQPILLEMESRDVLHSFWVPEFRVKQDLLPGRKTQLRITPTKIGEYRLRCAEICGEAHSTMLASVNVVSQADFEDWVAERLAKPAYASLSQAERGQLWYSSPDSGFIVCAGCHSVDGTRLAGPSWLGIVGRDEQLADGSMVVIDEAYIRESILHPNAKIVADFNPDVMPQTYEADFAALEAQIMADEGVEIDVISDLFAFMETLSE